MFVGRSATRLGAMLRQQLVEFIDAQALRRALGETFQAALGPQFAALGLQRAKV